MQDPSSNTERFSELLGVKFTPTQKRLIRIEAAHEGKDMSKFVRENIMRIAHQRRAERKLQAA